MLSKGVKKSKKFQKSCKTVDIFSIRGTIENVETVEPFQNNKKYKEILQMSNTEIAKQVIDAIGGVENVSSVAHCATRLRVMVKDESKINKDVVENIEKSTRCFL